MTPLLNDRRSITVDDTLPDTKVSVIEIGNETLRVRKLNDDLLVHLQEL